MGVGRQPDGMAPGRQIVAVRVRVAKFESRVSLLSMHSRISGEEWDRRYEEGTTPWDKGYGAPPLAEFLDRRRVEGRVLVPGCGTGHDVRLLASRGALPVGLDISSAAITLARSFPPVGKEEFLLGDFLSGGCGEAAFDWVFEHTCFCAISPEEREAYAEAVWRALKPGGHFLAIFFVTIEDPEGPPFPVSHEEIERIFGPRFDTIESWIPSRSYPAREGREAMRLMRRK